MAILIFYSLLMSIVREEEQGYILISNTINVYTM